MGYYKGKRGKCTKCDKVYGWETKHKLNEVSCPVCDGSLSKTRLNHTIGGTTRLIDMDVEWLDLTKKSRGMA